MSLILFLSFILLILGIIEYAIHQRRLKKIPIRIHVNGTRGKSTTTRLIAGVLREAGYVVIAKTTGSAARLILEDGSEVPVQRKSRRTPSIGEQIKIVAEASRRKADVLVIECMAINPEMQWVSEKRILQSSIGVLTNVREDHLDEMGPTLQDVASVLALAIPKDGKLILGEDQFLEFFRQESQALGTEVIVAQASLVEDQDLEPFSYVMFKENAACALKVGELLGVPAPVAWTGMYKAIPDVGSTQVHKIEHQGLPIYLVNALATNDLTSAVMVWEKWEQLAHNLRLGSNSVVGLLHNRADRSFRAEELVQTAVKLPFDSLYLTGDLQPVAKRLLKKHNFTGSVHSTGRLDSPGEILNSLTQHYSNTVVLFAYGNIKGFGEELAHYFDRNGEKISYDPRSNRFGASI